MKKVVSLFIILLLLVSCSTLIRFKGILIKPKKALKGMAYADNQISIIFTVNSKNINFVLFNKTEEPILIDWNKISIITPSGTSYRIIHKGIRFSVMDSPQAITLLAPKVIYSDVLSPTATIYLSSSLFSSSMSWKQRNMLDKKDIGKIIGVFFPMKIDDEKVNYYFKIRLISIKK